MSTLSSASTTAQVRAAYDDNASFDEDNSPSKAAAFITAVTILINRLPSRAEKGDSGMIALELERYEKQLQRARQFLATNGAAPNNSSVLHADFTNFRD